MSTFLDFLERLSQWKTLIECLRDSLLIHPIQLVEADEVVLHEQGDLPIRQDQPRKRAPPTCSGCGGIGHKINQCKNR